MGSKASQGRFWVFRRVLYRNQKVSGAFQVSVEQITTHGLEEEEKQVPGGSGAFQGVLGRFRGIPGYLRGLRVISMVSFHGVSGGSKPHQVVSGVPWGPGEYMRIPGDQGFPGGFREY